MLNIRELCNVGRIIYCGLLFFVSPLLLTGCTSLGHEARVQPQIERPLGKRPDVVAIVGTGELAVAFELLMVSRGIKVLASPTQIVSNAAPNARSSEPVTRYVVNVTSVDQDMCIPEGSRQMHFYISVVDLVENKRVIAMNGDYGCKDTIVRRFETWFFH